MQSAVDQKNQQVPEQRLAVLPPMLPRVEHKADEKPPEDARSCILALDMSLNKACL